ncbi:hypothetical protein DM860_017282 [Cuscuta australis]|uniref:Uncharacterized protein n=1 Tax=Cuscuta australis TaxID=267555 RepID=A0A328E7F2_9ASTE|nr:hypothetical protein DM860_017282 [Cuscuta australis]
MNRLLRIPATPIQWFADSLSGGRFTRRISAKQGAESPWESAEEGLVRCPANSAPLTPISFLERAAKVHGGRPSVVYGRRVRYRWEQSYERCLKLASALTQLGISHGDVVATLAPNVPAVQELHFAVPMAGAVLCTLNTRHDSSMVSTLLAHSEAKVLFVDYPLLPVARGAVRRLVDDAESEPPLLVLIVDPEEDSGFDSRVPELEYEAFLESGDSGFEIRWPRSEWDPISVNYTSGTTSRPKGVVYNHRGAFLNTIATAFVHEMSFMPVYLWTVPMFHCNGWNMVWGVAALGGTNVCLRRFGPNDIFDNIARHKVTHMGAAPTVLNMMVNLPLGDRKPLPHVVKVMTGGSPPPPQLLSKMEEMGFNLIHIYGLTETYGPGTFCMHKPEWDALPPEERQKTKARQGVSHFCLQDVDVRDPVTTKSVPADGKTMGEVMFRGNTVMSGYLKDRKATDEAFRDGWFHSGDLGVKHPDGYLEVKDRSKDIIISGGENICSVEVESVLYDHPAVLEAGVVGRPDRIWGETPCAFVKAKEGFEVEESELKSFCRERLPHYMAPRTIVFGDLPKTSTGKIQKYVLREKAKALGSLC